MDERRDVYEDISITRAHILRKKKILARKKRRARLKAFFVLIVLGLIGTAIVMAGIAVVTWGTRVYHEYETEYAAYTDRQYAWRGAVNPAYDSYTNILIMGLDDGVDASGQAGQRADTIVMLSYNNNTGQVNFLTIPRDTWVEVPGQGTHDRIGAVYASGGAPGMVRAVNALTGTSVHQYVAVNMKTFADILDVLGGVNLYVEVDMDYDDPEGGTAIHLKQGYQHLDGAQAVSYLRYRGTDLGDLGRVERQQKFLRTFYDHLLQFDTVPKLPQVAEIIRNHVETSAEIFDSAHLANVFRHMSTDRPQTVVLPGAPSERDDTIWVPDEAGIQRTMQQFFPDVRGESDQENQEE